MPIPDFQTAMRPVRIASRAKTTLVGKPNSFILDKACRWETWAAPKTEDGKIDHHKAYSVPDLTEFVDQKLFPYLKGFKQRANIKVIPVDHWICRMGVRGNQLHREADRDGGNL